MSASTRRSPDSPRGNRRATTLFRDDFERADSPKLGNGWTDGAAYDRSMYAPLGIQAGQLCCADPMAPVGPNKAIACCWRDMGTADVQATIRVPPQEAHFREAAPLLHVTPGTTSLGFGAWLSTFHGKSHLGFLLIGTLGHPVEEFTAFATATYPRDERSHLLTVRSVAGNAVCFFDGVQLELSENPSRTPISSIAVPPELRASTAHGVAIDCHLEPEETMGEPVVADCWFEAVE